MEFTKMHGLGNAYVFVNCFTERVADAVPLAIAVSDRNTGVGSDGLILICPSDRADVRMEMYNMDGSRGQMCGNGIRCVAKYVYDRGLCRHNPMTIETDAGVKTLQLTVERGKASLICVDMGEPGLRPEDLPVVLTADQMFDRPIEIMGHRARMSCVSMGNPHVVVFGVPLAELSRSVDFVSNLQREGSKIENDPMFPERTNVHFVQVNRPDDLTMLAWERGSGATQACGTGACAAGVAGAITGRSGRKVTVHLPGGDLLIDWRDNQHVYMTGPAVDIFTGHWPES